MWTASPTFTPSLSISSGSIRATPRPTSLERASATRRVTLFSSVIFSLREGIILIFLIFSLDLPLEGDHAFLEFKLQNPIGGVLFQRLGVNLALEENFFGIFFLSLC